LEGLLRLLLLLLLLRLLLLLLLLLRGLFFCSLVRVLVLVPRFLWLLGRYSLLSGSYIC